MNVQIPEPTTVIGDVQIYTLVKVVTVSYETNDPAARIFLPAPVTTRENVTFTANTVTETRYELPTAMQPATPTVEPFLDESWRDAVLHKGTPETAPKLPLVWIEANDPNPANVAAALVADELFGYALELAVLEPKWGTTYGDRVFPTKESRWEIFQPYANQEMWLRAPFRFITPVQIHNSGGAGEWLSALLQAKSGDRADINALFQMNLKPDPVARGVRLWCELPYGTAREIAPFYLPPPGEPFIVTLRYKWSSDATGGFDLFMNGKHCWTGTGRTGHKVSGYGNFAPLVYGNILDAPLTLRVGQFKASTASLL
jgi:hypothetical protein